MKQETINQKVELLGAALGYAGRGWPVLPLHNPVGTEIGTVHNGGDCPEFPAEAENGDSPSEDRKPGQSTTVGTVPGFRCSCGRGDCGSVGKHPRTPHGLKDASTDAERIRKWWAQWPEANVGICTGAASFIVLDVDAGHGGEESLDALEAKHGALPETVEALTGGGGRHIMFKHPGWPVRNKVALAPGLDVRGDGGYVVAAPSLHASGRHYAWEMSSRPGEVKLAPLPDWLYANLSLSDRAQGELGPASPASPQGSSGEPIPKGKRDATLASLAGSMRRRGMGVEAIEAALSAENEARCRPPLPAADVARIARSVGRYDPEPGASKPQGKGYNRTDLGNAELIADMFGERLRYDHRLSRWLIWREHWWEPDRDGVVHRIAKRGSRLRYERAAEVGDLKEREQEAKWAIKSEDTYRILQTIRSAESEHPMADAGEEWDADPWLLGVANGVVDLRTGELRDGRPEDMVTMHSEVAFDPEAQCPRWDEFVAEIASDDEELIEFVHRAVGYSLTADRREQCAFILYGNGANGKSVFLRTLRQVLGPYAYEAGFSTFAYQSRQGIPEDLANLVNKRLVTASECTAGTRLNEGRLKAITGGDEQNARFLRKDRFTFEPVCAIWLAVNHRPVVRDDSVGFWRKVRMVPFTRQFLGDDADPLLNEKLKGEVAGILAWGVRGASAWHERGLTLPDTVVDATGDYELESDPLGQWITEECVIEAQATARAGVMYQAYDAWCGDAGMTKRERMSLSIWGRQMGERFRKQHGREGWIYFGVRLQDSAGN